MTIDGHQWLVWLHILLFVFWLGADVGVFAAASWAKREGMPIDQRLLLFGLAGFIDLFPRICMAFILPTGLMLVRPWGLTISDGGIAAAWGVALLWAAGIVAAYRHANSPLAARIGRMQMIAFVGGGLLMLGWAWTTEQSGAIPTWLTLKIALFGVIFFLAIGIDLSFRPVLRDLVRLGQEHDTDVLQQTLRRSVNRCLAVVTMLYAVLLLASFLGVTKAIA